MNKPSLVGSVVMWNSCKQPSDSEMEQATFEQMALLGAEMEGWRV